MARSMRNFRLDDEVYAAAQERARREYTNVTAVIEQYLASYGGLRRSGEEKPEKRSQPSRTVVGYSKEQQTRGRKP